MIQDKTENLRAYERLNPLIALVADYLETHDIGCLPPGRHDIKPGELYVNIDVTPGRTPEEAPFEAHRLMTDIQMPLSQEESYGYAPLADLPPAPYDAARDITLYPKGAVQPRSRISCRPGEFVLFAPQDAHQPCLCQGTIRKAVFKLKS